MHTSRKRFYFLMARSSQDELLWRMWETARKESIAAQQMMQTSISWSLAAITALVLAISFLSDTDLAPGLIRLVGWFAILFLGALSGSQYLMEAKRMVRAGRFAFELEKRARLKDFKRLDEACFWEHHLKDLRLLLNYKTTAAAAILALFIAQAAPFLIYPTERLYLGRFSFFPWILPIAGAFCLMVFYVLDYTHFKKNLDKKWGKDWDV